MVYIFISAALKNLHLFESSQTGGIAHVEENKIVGEGVCTVHIFDVFHLFVLFV